MSTADQKLGGACGMQCAMLLQQNFPTLEEIQRGNHDPAQWLMAFTSPLLSLIYTKIGPDHTLNFIEWMRQETVACRLREAFVPPSDESAANPS